ncbi:MAG: polysaccharide deacetylase family protein [Clostridia bacterium]|nr:polysaccharide deacetylase family protein [Clostridia bacterium]
MNRKFWLTVLTAGFILFIAASARAETRMIGSVSGGSLKLRSTTSTSADNVVGSYSSGTQVNILSESGSWYFVEVNGQFGYMMSKYIKVSTEYEHMGWGIVEEENAVINVFSSPDISSKVMYKCLCGARFEIVGHENGWYRVRSGHDFGYILDQYLIPTDTAYEAITSLLSGDTAYTLSTSGINTNLHETGSQKSMSSSGGNLTCTIRYPVYTLGQIDAALSRYVHQMIDIVTRDHSEYHQESAATLEISYNSVRLDEGCTAVVLVGKYSVSGIEPLPFIRAFTLDTANDRVLTPNDYMADRSRITFQANAKYRRIFNQVSGGYEAPEDLVWPEHCVLDTEGVTFYLMPGEGLPLEAGCQRITLKYSQCADYLSMKLQAIENGRRKIDPSRPMIALTFDDGPSEETFRILDVLEEYGGRATFCVVGSRLTSYSNVLVYTAAQENEIACHTWDHKKLTELNANQMRSQITRVNELVFEMTGREIRVLRCPYGSFNSTLRRVCADLGMVIASWQTDTLDWSTRNTKKTYRSLVNNAENGNIFLMHDLYSTTAEAVIQAIPVLVGGGYQLVTVSELLSFHKEGIVPGTVYMHLDPANIAVR